MTLDLFIIGHHHISRRTFTAEHKPPLDLLLKKTNGWLLKCVIVYLLEVARWSQFASYRLILFRLYF